MCYFSSVFFSAACRESATGVVEGRNQRTKLQEAAGGHDQGLEVDPNAFKAPLSSLSSVTVAPCFVARVLVVHAGWSHVFAFGTASHVCALWKLFF